MPHFVPATRACIALLAIAGPATVGLAQSPSDIGHAETVWHCWDNHDTTFRCRLARAREDPGDRGARVPQSRPSLYPRRGPLPPIVSTIHEHPARLRSRTITIPLLSPPRDSEFAATLVQAVMCDIRPACRVLILPSSAAVIDAYEEDPARDDPRAGRPRGIADKAAAGR